MPSVSTFRCASCGAEHEGPPLSYGALAPVGWETLPDSFERVLGGEQAMLVQDGTPVAWFLKGNIDIPLIDVGGVFSWTVWVSLSEESFNRVSDRWLASDRADDPPYFGWLRTELPVYPQCTVLKTMVHSRAPGVRPFIEIEHTDHQLSVEQRTGITMQRVEEIAASLMHGSG